MSWCLLYYQKLGIKMAAILSGMNVDKTALRDLQNIKKTEENANRKEQMALCF
jgi:hypothetical protein